MEKLIESYYRQTSEDEDKLVFAAEILRSQTLTLRKVFPTTGGFYSDEVCYYFDALPSRFSPTKSFDQDALDKYDGPQLLKVNESNVKHFKSNPNCKHIDEFFYSWDETSNTYIVDSKLKIFLTGKAIGSVPDWLRRVGFINPEYSEMYESLRKYVDVYRNIDVSSAGLKDIIDVLERMIEFQHFVNSTDNQEDIAEKSRELFILEDIKAADILDYEAVKLNRSKEEFIEGVDNLMCHISFPYDNSLFEKERFAFSSFVPTIKILLRDCGNPNSIESKTFQVTLYPNSFLSLFRIIDKVFPILSCLFSISCLTRPSTFSRIKP